MIEIAISLAVIGFALVAILGILPIAMQTQKDNRQETIINQDASVFFDAIRNGEYGLDDLTNYVVAITNYVTEFTIGPPQQWQNGYTYRSSSTSPQLLLTNGAQIVGLLSTPTIIALPSPNGRSAAYVSNHVVAYVRSMSGNAAEKGPATYTPGINPVQDLTFNLGFNYRLIPEVVPYFAYNANGLATVPWGVPAGPPGLGAPYARFTQNLQTNLHEVRLIFRWPLLPTGDAGPGRQVFRGTAAGLLSWRNDSLGLAWPPLYTNQSSTMDTSRNGLATTLFFVQPRTYLQVQTP